jgi:hypothetical protein
MLMHPGCKNKNSVCHPVDLLTMTPAEHNDDDDAVIVHSKLGVGGWQWQGCMMKF